MAIALTTLVEETDRYLNVAKIADYCPNGLQVEGDRRCGASSVA